MRVGCLHVPYPTHRQHLAPRDRRALSEEREKNVGSWEQVGGKERESRRER